MFVECGVDNIYVEENFVCVFDFVEFVDCFFEFIVVIMSEGCNLCFDFLCKF